MIFKENKSVESSLLPVMFLSEQTTFIFHENIFCDIQLMHKMDVHTLIILPRDKIPAVLLTDCKDGHNNNTYLIKKKA